MQHLRPLTPAEREVAAKHYKMVDRFLSAHRLPRDDWWDVVIFSYLRTVELWFSNPKLCKYSFSTIAWNAMFTAVGNENAARRRRIQTVSLDDVIPGTDGLTYADIITEENIDYTPYLKEAQ